MNAFRAVTYQNEYLPRGGSETNAIVTVTSDAGSEPLSASAAEIVIIDTSGSMSGLGKLSAAKRATAAAIDCIRDGVAFAVIAGTDAARPVYPTGGTLAPAAPATREAAKAAVLELSAGGGTAIGTWLSLAAQLFTTAAPHAIRHAVLLTDGRNESEEEAELVAAVEACVGVFACDCRGVGTDWEVAELRRIASALLGTVDIVAEPSGLEADFRSMVEGAMGKRTGDVRLRVWTPVGATVAFVKQVAPTVEELSGRASGVDGSTVEYATGAWGQETRDYHLCIRVPARAAGEEMLAGRVSVLVGEEVVGQALIRVIWTDDEQLSTRINPEVAHYTGQAELAEAIQQGLQARKAGDEATATLKLGRAAQLAAESGNDATLALIAHVVEIEDAATGTVHLKSRVDDADEMTLDTRSTRSVRARPSQ